MKLYVFSFKKAITNILGIAALIVLVMMNRTQSQTVFRTESIKKLPIYCVETDKKVCALSFDAAWGAEDTDTLIEILDKYNAKATFFVVGEWVDKYPEEVKKLHKAGHDVMNHSNTHKYMTKIDNATLVNEVEKCSDKIEKLLGVRPTLFRAPYGDYNSEVISKLLSMGYHTIQWDVDSLDWKEVTISDIYNKVISNVKNGSIILFHNAAKNTPEALPKILEKLKNDGYSFVKISDMIYKEDYYIDNSGMQISNKSLTEEIKNKKVQ